MHRPASPFAACASFLFIAVLTACTSGSNDAAPPSTVQVRPTNYVTLPPVTTPPPTTTIPGQEPPDSVQTAGEGEVYRVRAGDALPLIADRYDITVEELADYNNWSDGARHPIYPEDEVQIPPFAGVPADVQGDLPNDDGLGTMPELNGAPLCADGTQREVYEIRSGDFIGRVANKNDISIEELTAANEDNPAWNSFIPGTELWLPCDGEDLQAGTSEG